MYRLFIYLCLTVEIIQLAWWLTQLVAAFPLEPKWYVLSKFNWLFVNINRKCEKYMERWSWIVLFFVENIIDEKIKGNRCILPCVHFYSVCTSWVTAQTARPCAFPAQNKTENYEKGLGPGEPTQNGRFHCSPIPVFSSGATQARRAKRQVLYALPIQSICHTKPYKNCIFKWI